MAKNKSLNSNSVDQLLIPNQNIKKIVKEDVNANGDKVLLEVVLNNLIGNAWKYARRLTNAVIEFGTKGRSERTGEFCIR